MDDFEDFGDLGLDLGGLFDEDYDNEESYDISAYEVAVIPINVDYGGKGYTFYTTDSVATAQTFNEKDSLDELSIGKIFLLPEGIEIINDKLLSKFEILPEVYIKKEEIEKSIILDFSNLILRNHLKYVRKRGN